MIDTSTLINPDYKDLNLALNVVAKCGLAPWVPSCARAHSLGFPEHKELLAEHRALLALALPGDMVRWPVSSPVGTVKNNDPSLIESDFPR